MLRVSNRRFYSDLAHKYSSSVLLPKTSFPKRSNLEKVQQDLIPRSSQQLYKEQLNSKPLNNDSDLFIIHDGPPYANGDLHLGHALNKILKDVINRYNLLNGKQIYYKPGWDCHGLPIELKALEKISKKMKKDSSTVLSVGEIRKLAREHANSTITSQLEGFKSLGIMTDFEHNYKTLNHSFEINQLKVFQGLLKRGLIKRQKKPVYWGCQTHTALAEGELEYNDNHKSITLHLKFPIIKPSVQLSAILAENSIKDVKALIWTSTPWTIPSNKAISINTEFEYVILKNTKVEDEFVIVANELSSTVLSLNPDFESTNIVVPGSALISSQYTNPLIENSTFPIIHGDHVTSTAGTGLVHTAPGHGNDDYFVCLANGIDVYSPVDQFGKYTDQLPEGVFQHLKGLFVLGKGTEEILKILGGSGMVYYRDDNYIHSYPYDWRSKKPIIIRATPQWFTNVGEIKEASLKALEDVEFIPARGKNRLSAFIKNRNEWCISRQRSWGVPIPALYGRNDENHVIMDEESVEFIIAKIDELGTDAWFEEEEDIERWLPARYAGQGKDLVKGKDTMDVWFDSGSSWNEIREFLEENQITNRSTYADVYLEGSDQHRGWFQSSLLTKVGITPATVPAVAPYKKIVTHGFTLDEKGFKMSKSLGNTLTPETIIKGQGKALPGVGVDGLRMWVAQSDYTNDMSMGPNVLKHVGDALKKLRITFTFLLGNLNDLRSAEDLVKFEELNKIDQFALSRLAQVNEEVLAHYEQYNFNRVLKTLTNHLNIELSAIYFDIVKDRLYTDGVDSRSRRAAQTVLYHIFQTYLSLLSPIIPVMTQEVWDFTPKWIVKGQSNAILNGVYVDELAKFQNVGLEADFAKVWELRDQITTLIEKGRKEEKTIKNSLETEVYISFANPESSELSQTLTSLESELSDYYLVSKLHLNKPLDPSSAKFHYSNKVAVAGEFVNISIVNATNCKCPRCWRYSSISEEALCKRCDDVVVHEH
ncbi:hypothetical protein WICPIJ_000011 [Wickerhamomyces pijperi]|uniref:isoleucine--tRNA ligase n=1 Tax=Wickerhamomyces pijperi TaxID=599730 RepID=A0A9P8QDH0_WICPI|nr:hypothetical protein WICPIJ_000011 [Wickerhamomyces pijperi]